MWACRQAKLDALAALAACAGGWGGHALAGRCNLQALWEGLRTEMLAQPDPMADDDSGAVPAAARAALMVLPGCNCLRFCHTSGGLLAHAWPLGLHVLRGKPREGYCRCSLTSRCNPA